MMTVGIVAVIVILIGMMIQLVVFQIQVQRVMRIGGVMSGMAR